METVKFIARINAIGSSHYFAIPKPLLEYLDANVGSYVEMSGFSGKNGRFIALWKKNGGNVNDTIDD